MWKWVGRIALVAVVLLVVAFVALASWEPFWAKRDAQAGPQGSYRAEIVRDDYGVPHILGKTDADVAYGVAIAHAEDDFTTLQDVIAMSRGRYGAIAGQEGAAADYVYHLLDARGTAEREFPRLPADTQALFQAYAAGLNRFAEDHPDEIKLANLFPVDGKDVAAGFALRQPFFFGLNNVIQPLVEGTELRREFGPDIPGFERPPSGDVGARPGQVEEGMEGSEAAPRAAFSPFGSDGALNGSNAFAVSAEKSGGPVTLISNSHQPLRGGVAWYELVVESGEGWHFAGANFPGSPFPFLGHNEELGWTNTVNRPDMVDVYKLEVNADGTQYRFGGEWRPLERKTVTLPVKLGPVTLPIRRDVLRSIHGPVIQNDQGYFAIRYGGMGNLGQLDAYYRLNKAKTYDEWEAIIARLDIPSTNFLYADKAGNIAYVYNAALPNRPAEVDGKRVDWRGILDGSNPKLLTRGTVDFDKLPRYLNPGSGWLYNSNNEPYTAAGAGDDLSPDEYAPELGIELKQTNRSRRAWTLMCETEVLDRANLERIKYDTAYSRTGYVAKLWAALERLDLSGDAGLDRARDLLLAWDFKADNIGTGDALALLMIRDFMSAEYQNKPEAPDVRDMLEQSVAHLEEHFGRIDPPMSDLLRLRLGDVDLPLDGGSDTLRASTTWTVDDDGRLRLVHGDSFIQWVEWNPGERVFSRSIQPFGAANGREESPHYTDQMQLFVDHKLKPVHFWRDDVLRNAARRYTVESH
ncbi:acylase [Qipengyuania oceanensis]|uniref:Acylase n=1 Tax=Qipengyuania oceanensis TaxID=1463597 RepID=A0A844YHD7_9SPHN|nr:acylase [Qipengyuania oceanensis]MXO62448.1 acylase [Qipengyuania oceanensis]